MAENIGNIDDRLVGYWSSLEFSYGVMEATDVGFLADGRGWSAVYNAVGLCVTRFRWSCPEPGLLELRSEWLVEGDSVAQPGPPVFATTQPPEAWVEVTLHHYAFGREAPSPGAEPVPALLLQEHIDFAYVLAPGSREITPEDDPSHHVLPYAESASASASEPEPETER
ncbi:hypothetical protein KDL01_14340 [Actinospica durhamensis]|uniref:Uncharacterized protein n=1 Tax=Actinospica durhamensis TaxID=1508375 RepID=A0A941IMQ2_9ACTN|nr:hypothetical protein [Actinospica durhamensis]MBR7834450.1 hypothetical protein [Actinospica durhamensis]